jgi:hypothetical protein
METLDEYKPFAIELAQLCTKHKLTIFQGTFSGGIAFKHWRTVNFGWNSGRHNDSVGEVTLTSTVNVLLKVKEEV